MKNKLTKVIHVSTVHPTFDNRIFFKECQSLSEANYEVILITPYEETKVIDKIKIIGISEPKNRIWRMLFTTCMATLLALNEKPSLFHLHDPELMPMGFFLSLMGKNVIFDMHENLPATILNKRYLPKLLRKLLSNAFRFIENIFLINQYIVLAENIYKRNHNWQNRKKIVLNFPQINKLLNIKEEKYNTFTAGYIGLITAKRGSRTMLKTTKLLSDRGHKISLELVGKCEHRHRADLESYQQREKINNVRFHGFLKALDGYRIMARCHVGLVLLEPTPNYIRSYPTKLFEYMALGLPVVLSDFPFYRSIVSEANCALLVNPSDPVNIADAIQWIIKNPDASAAMGARGRQIVSQRYNWNTEAQKLIEFYKTILRK